MWKQEIKSKTLMETELEKNSRKSPKQFWRNIKGNAGYKNNSDKIPPQEWCIYFKSLLCPETEIENTNDNLLDDIWQDNESSELNAIITDDEINRSGSHIHSNKSSGPDGICIELYKFLRHESRNEEIKHN